MKELQEVLFASLQEYPWFEAVSGNVLFLSALPHPKLQDLQSGRLHCVQPLSGICEQLKEMGLEVIDEAQSPYSLALLLGGRDKDELLSYMALGLHSLQEGGVMAVAIPNVYGALRYEKMLKKAARQVFSLSKSHCRVFGTVAKDLNQETLSHWQQLSEPSLIPGSTLYSVPGIFAHGKIDKGSQLLIEHLPHSLSGRGADFGAGYGYLSRELLWRCPEIEELWLYEVDKRALQMAERNLSSVNSKAALNFRWQDISKKSPEGPFDWVIMNPPLHRRGEVDTSLGRIFIERAASALKKRGRLYLVANRSLNLEQTIKDNFEKQRLIIQKTGFKVIEAAR